MKEKDKKKFVGFTKAEGVESAEILEDQVLGTFNSTIDLNPSGEEGKGVSVPLGLIFGGLMNAVFAPEPVYVDVHKVMGTIIRFESEWILKIENTDQGRRVWTARTILKRPGKKSIEGDMRVWGFNYEHLLKKLDAAKIEEGEGFSTKDFGDVLKYGVRKVKQISDRQRERKRERDAKRKKKKKGRSLRKKEK